MIEDDRRHFRQFSEPSQTNHQGYHSVLVLLQALDETIKNALRLVGISLIVA